jgi:hypothetical protein
MIPVPRLLVVVCSVFLVTLAAPAAEAGLRILSLEPTVLFPKREPLAQVARLTVVNDSGGVVTAEAVVTVAGGAVEKIVDLSFAPNQSTVEVLVPDLAAAATVKVELRRAGAVVATHEQPWQPQRKWKIHIVKASHEDIGYENYIFKKQKEIADFIDLAQEQASPKSVAGNIGTALTKQIGYHYTLETILFQRNYIEERGEQAWRQLVNRDLKPGHMSMMGAPSGVHAHWMDYEQLARQGYPARRETLDRFGLDIRTYMIVDNPSLSWAGAQALADSGFKYVARWGQGWRTGGNNDYATTKVPAIFWWQGPNGSSRILFSWRSHYAMGFFFGQTGTYRTQVDLASGHVSDFLRKVEDGSLLGPYPYDALVTPEYIDHDIPRYDKGSLQAWHNRYAYPDIRISSPDDFFTYVEGKYGATLPVLSGDLNNFSADYSSIDPVSQDWKRQASRLLPAAEGIGVLAGAAAPAFALLPSEVERLYTRMFDYDEHCWPTLPRATDQQLFNAVWVKNHEAKRALDGATSAFRQGAAALGGNIASPGEGSFAVFNPLAHPRTDLVEAPGTAVAVTDLRTGRSIPCEQVAPDRFAFLAADVPAFGYALYRPDPAAKPAATAAELKAERLSISNQFYTVRFHPENGSVTSIVDRANGRELIDAGAPYLANQLVYVHKNEREAKEGFEYKPAKAARMEPRVGRTQVAFDVWIDDAKLGGKIRQTVTLHAGVKRVDFTNRLESIDVMHSMVYEDRYRDNLYYAFPFAVAGGQIRAEQAGGVVRPYDDQLRWGSHDYLPVNRWIDVSNAGGGVTLATREASTFSLGEIRYNQFAVDYKPSQPWLFSYAWSNRMAGLITLENDDCNATFNYSLTSHDGDWNSGAAVRHGWQHASPLLVVPVTGDATARWTDRQKSFLATDAANVQLTVLKASGIAGRGWVARFIETDGRGTEFELDVSALGVGQAVLCDLVENDGQSLPVKNGKVRVPIRPFSFATVRLVAGSAPAAVAQVEARGVTDSTVRLAWSGSGPAYNVYRSDDPDAPATAYTMVARTAAPEFADQGLSVATKYYYRVAAVSAANLEGPLSAPLVVQTSRDNRSAPAPIHEFGVVRRSPDTLIVYWRKNPEPDVASYRVFRGETPDFSAEGREPVAVLEANAYFLQIFRDSGLQPGKTYYYRVQPVDWSNNRQAVSPLASATTPKDHP